ncbi:type II toxin-antitoxin system prevent-host-death family antitoxin [Acinetobacter modestus]|uniref:type II toxin-antitoxin system Phd/YefM family antitoxin n=1 Tax=Acinetobacter modestus TaxID=1776740 RepID=UPI0030174F7E
MHVYTYTDARTNFKSLLDQVNNDADVAIITRRESPSVVVMGQQHYESLMETIYLLSTPANAKHLMESIEQFKSGKVVQRDLIDE